MKRFYKAVSVGAATGESGSPLFDILLDGRPVRTPAGNVLRLPTRALAEIVAAEWATQGETIDPLSMPHLRLANTAIDGAGNREKLIAAILRFGEADALCYRVRNPAGLAQRQREGWDPMLAWAERRHGARLAADAALTHIDQPPDARTALARAVESHDDFCLAALHAMASITGSLVLALALAEDEIGPARAFELSRIEEDYQAEKWGTDRQARARAETLSRELANAAQFLAAARE
jgi:chaperone required for assembly of F1-ATPase